MPNWPTIECTVCGASADLDCHIVVACAEMATFIDAHSDHDRVSVAATLPPEWTLT